MLQRVDQPASGRGSAAAFRTIAGLGLWATIATPGLSAQQVTQPSAMPVRVTVAPDRDGAPRHYEGWLLRRRADTLAVSRGYGRPVLTFVLDRNTTAETLLGVRRHGGTGAGLGLLLGSIIGGVAGATSDDEFLGKGASTFLGSAAGALAGTFVGWIVGYNTVSRTWTPLQTGDVRIGIAPAGAGLQIRLSLRDAPSVVRENR